MIKIIFIIIIIFSNKIYSQELYKLYLRNDDIIIGNLIKKDNQEIQIKVKNEVKTYKLSYIAKIDSFHLADKGSFGIGFGIPYGVLGINLDLKLVDNFYLTAGVGTTLLWGVAYNVGGKYYLKKPGYKWRPRISLYYGTNTVNTAHLNNSDEEASFNGLTLGIGQSFNWGDKKNKGIDLDLMFIVSNSQAYYNKIDQWEKEGYEVETGSGVKISIGYRFGF